MRQYSIFLRMAARGAWNANVSIAIVAFFTAIILLPHLAAQSYIAQISTLLPSSSYWYSLIPPEEGEMVIIREASVNGLNVLVIDSRGAALLTGVEREVRPGEALLGCLIAGYVGGRYLMLGGASLRIAGVLECRGGLVDYSVVLNEGEMVSLASQSISIWVSKLGGEVSVPSSSRFMLDVNDLLEGHLKLLTFTALAILAIAMLFMGLRFSADFAEVKSILEEARLTSSLLGGLIVSSSLSLAGVLVGVGLAVITLILSQLFGVLMLDLAYARPSLDVASLIISAIVFLIASISFAAGLVANR